MHCYADHLSYGLTFMRRTQAQAVALGGSPAFPQNTPPAPLRPRSAGRSLGALLCLSLVLCWSLPVIAQNASGDKPGTTKANKATKKATSKPGKPTARNKKAESSSSSQETTKERERRLLRECKGRPNAGACEGFAS